MITSANKTSQNTPNYKKKTINYISKPLRKF